jgi:methionyl-tRNA formyltransferase
VTLATAPAHPRRLVFLGTPEPSVVALRGLLDAGWDVALVVSQPDRRRGRGGHASASPVKQAALDAGVATSDAVDDVLDAGADLGVVAAFGRLIKPHVLERLPMVNLHYSLLPRWRGAAPVERAILAGDDRTGVDLMVVEEGLDTGGVYRRAELAIGSRERRSELVERLVEAGVPLLTTALAEGLGEPSPQEGEPTYADKLDPAELRIDWSRPAEEVDRLVRLEEAWTAFRGQRLKVLRGEPTEGRPLPPGTLDGVEVGTGDGRFGLERVQPAGKGPQAAADWARGARIEPGERLGGEE